MSSSSFIKKIEELQKSIEEIRVSSFKKSKKINNCTRKSELKNYTMDELVKWLEKNGVSIKKTLEKNKKNFIDLVWDNLFDSDTDSATETDSDSEPDSETDTESDSESEHDS